MKTKLCTGLGFFLQFFWLSQEVLAQYDLKRINNLPASSKTDLDTTTAINSLLQGGADILALMVGSVAILFIVINAGRMAFSFGDSEALSKARKGILWSLGGLILVIFSYVIAKSVIALVYA